MRTQRAEIKRLRSALELVVGSKTHEAAVAVASVALHPMTAALYHGPSFWRRFRRRG